MSLTVTEKNTLILEIKGDEETAQHIRTAMYEVLQATPVELLHGEVLYWYLEILRHL